MFMDLAAYYLVAAVAALLWLRLLTPWASRTRYFYEADCLSNASFRPNWKPGFRQKARYRIARAILNLDVILARLAVWVLIPGLTLTLFLVFVSLCPVILLLWPAEGFLESDLGVSLETKFRRMFRLAPRRTRVTEPTLAC